MQQKIINKMSSLLWESVQQAEVEVALASQWLSQQLKMI